MIGKALDMGDPNASRCRWCKTVKAWINTVWLCPKCDKP